MEHCTDSFELLALNRRETTTEDSELKQYSLRRLPQRKRRYRATVTNRSLLDSSSKKYSVLSKCCWHIFCLFFVGNLLWVFRLTWVATQLKSDMQTLRDLTEKGKLVFNINMFTYIVGSLS